MSICCVIDASQVALVCQHRIPQRCHLLPSAYPGPRDCARSVMARAGSSSARAASACPSSRRIQARSVRHGRRRGGRARRRPIDRKDPLRQYLRIGKPRMHPQIVSGLTRRPRLVCRRIRARLPGGAVEMVGRGQPSVETRASSPTWAHLAATLPGPWPLSDSARHDRNGHHATVTGPCLEARDSRSRSM